MYIPRVAIFRNVKSRIAILNSTESRQRVQNHRNFISK